MAGSANPSAGGGGGGAAKDIDPSIRSAASNTMNTRTRILRACYGGTETMRAMAEEFLPIYEKESQNRWNARLAATFALNKLREAVDASSAKPFRTLLKLTNNTDTELEEWIKDIDLQGNHLHLFAHQFMNNAMLDGQCHFLVDHPTTVNLPNLAAQKAAGVRPFWKLIKDQQLIAAYNEYVGGDTQVTHCRFQTQRTERTDTYEEIVWDQIWVIEKEPGTMNGVVKLYEQENGKSGGWADMGETRITLPEVPLVTMYAGEKESEYVSRAIFTDLAYKQIEHWQSSSDQRAILSAGRFPMLACSGVQLDDTDDDPDFAIGPWKILYSPEAAGRWYYVEPKGSAIEAGAKDLATLELHMDMMALNPVQATHRQYVPQNERDIQETRVHSVIHDIALSCKNALERGVRFMGQWQNRDFSLVGVGLNSDFTNTKEKMAEIGVLMQAWEKRGISRETFLKEARQRDLFGDDFDPAAEAKLMEALDAAITAAENGSETGASKPAPAKPSETGWNGDERPTKQI